MTKIFNAFCTAATGKNGSEGFLSGVDCMVGLSFGARPEGEGPSPVNLALARYMIAESNRSHKMLPGNPELPIIAQGEIADAIASIDEGFAAKAIKHVIRGEPSSNGGGGLDSYGVLLDAKRWMDENCLEKPILAGHAHHIGRIAAQAYKLGIEDYAIANDLPDSFDKKSSQWWTRSKELWMLREIPGVFFLWLQGKI